MGLDICHVKLSAKTKNTIEYFTLDELSSNPGFIEKRKNLITQNDEGESVMYYTDIAHLRKRVTENFSKEFVNDKLYFDLSDVKKVKQYLKANPGESQTDLEELFQKTFIDNFIEGDSIFFISY